MELGDGMLNIRNNLTSYDTFDFAPITVDENNNQTVGDLIDGTGNTNLGAFPEFRYNLGLAYAFGQHNISLSSHFRSGLDAAAPNSITGSVETSSMTTFDMSYSYVVSPESKLQLGCINCGDRDPVFNPSRSVESGYFRSVDDPRGLVVYARWTQSF